MMRLFSRCASLLLVLTILFACEKKLDTGQLFGKTVSSDLTHAENIYNRVMLAKTEGKYSDTMAACEIGGGIVFVGNSQIERWIYYNWAKTWMGLPVINRGIGGTRWLDLYPHIKITITDYKPKVVVLYQGENEYLRFPVSDNKEVAKTIYPEFIKYYDEVRKQNPAAHIVMLSMLACPELTKRGYDAATGSDIQYLDSLYEAKVKEDSALGNRASYVDVKSVYSASNLTLFRPDLIHLNNYGPMVQRSRPVIADAYNNYKADTTATVPTDSTITTPVDSTVTTPVDSLKVPPTDTLTPPPADTLTTPPADTISLPPVDTVVTEPVDTLVTPPVVTEPVKYTVFLGSSTVANLDLGRYFPGDTTVVKKGFPGYKWSDIYYNMGDVATYNAKQVIVYSGDNDIVQKIPLSTMQSWFQRICNKVWAYDSTIVITFMYTKPSEVAKNVVYESVVNGEVVRTSGWSMIEYFNRNMTNWLKNYHAHHSNVADTYSPNLVFPGKTLRTSHYLSDLLHWNLQGYDQNMKRVLPLVVRN